MRTAEQLGAGSRAERVEEIEEYSFELLEVHDGAR
jgi:hypothetical protein